MHSANLGRDLDRAVRSFGAVGAEAKSLELERTRQRMRLSVQGEAIHKKILNVINNGKLGKIIHHALKRAPEVFERIGAEYETYLQCGIMPSDRGVLLYSTDVSKEKGGETIGTLEYILIKRDLNNSGGVDAQVFFRPDKDKIGPHDYSKLGELEMKGPGGGKHYGTFARVAFAERGEKTVLDDVNEQLGDVTRGITKKIAALVKAGDKKNKRLQELLEIEEKRRAA